MNRPTPIQGNAMRRQPAARSPADAGANGKTRAGADERGERIVRWVVPTAIALDVEASSAEGLIRSAARLAAVHCDRLDPERTFRALWRREQAGSTGLGMGVAVPHARIDGVEHPTLFYVRTRCAIPFGAPDGRPTVHFIVIVVPPEGDVEDHLELLARVSQLFSERAFRERLAMAGSVANVRLAFADALGTNG